MIFTFNDMNLWKHCNAFCKMFRRQFQKLSPKGLFEINSAVGICFSSVQFSCSVISIDSLQRHDLQHARPPCPSQTPSLPKLMSTVSVMPSSHLILCCPLFLLPSIFPSLRLFSNESTLRIRWPTYWSFSFSISPSNEQPGLISFRMDWLDPLAVQETLKVFSNTTLQKHRLFDAQLSLWSNSHIHT